MASNQSQTPVGTSRKVRWWFRLAAVALGLSIFVFAEAVCALFDWGHPSDFDDPFVGFSAIHPLFVLDESGTNYQIPRSRQKFFAPDSFKAQKPPDAFRIFCLGGSTVQGRPYSKETSFSTWLEIALQCADKRRNWDVINCGGISYASYRLVPILQECLAYQPDLFIICTGHNEFLEDRSYGHIKRAPDLVSVPHRFLAQFRIYALLRHALTQINGQTAPQRSHECSTLTAEVDALLDYHGGLKAYRRDEQWKAGVIAHYEHNLRRMIALASKHNIPVLLIRPPSNLSDCPPFKSQHRDGLSASHLQKWKQLVHSARKNYRQNLPRAIAQLKQAIEIDEHYALIYYELGKCYEVLQRREDSRKAFLRARELDICPLRILEPMEKAVAQVAHDTGTPLIDAHALLEQRTAEGILGGYLLVDHIHPSIHGHKLLANELVATMAREGWVKPAPDWMARCKQAYQKHFESLDDLYFLHGQRNLEGLRLWTQGRADGLPIEEYQKAKREKDRTNPPLDPDRTPK